MNNNSLSQNHSTNFNNRLDPEFPDHHMVNSFREASEEIGEIRQDLRNNTAIGRLELRLGTLETLMSRFLDEQKQIRDRVSKIEIDLRSCNISTDRSAFRPILSPKSPVQNDIQINGPLPNMNSDLGNIREQHPPNLQDRLYEIEQEVRRTMSPRTAPLNIAPVNHEGRSRTDQSMYNSTGWDHNRPNTNRHQGHISPDNVRYTAGHDTRNFDRSNHTVRFTSTRDFDEISDFPTRLGQSMLIPIHDLKTARASLPQFSGEKEEDPMRFISNSECILQQANIHKSAWVRTIEPRLTGSALTGGKLSAH